jgi:hypothetical protein
MMQRLDPFLRVDGDSRRALAAPLTGDDSCAAVKWNGLFERAIKTYPVHESRRFRQ